MKGKLLIFSAPSGAGKTSIVRYLLDSGLNLEFSVSATSRKKRGEEIHGHDYFFYSSDEFREKISKGEFAEWEEVYNDHYYGTLKSEILRIRKKGRHVLFDIDVEGGLKLKQLYNKEALAIFVMPPSPEVLKERLIKRATDSYDNIMMRLEKAEKELARVGEFDRLIVNENLETACKEAYKIVKDFIS
ncbi:MAG: guanylate kinase [Marinilabiliaceae bacterium]|nr:guanylate kinase [Marinilabiliaceae bacterium]